MNLCKHLDIVKHYENLSDTNRRDNIVTKKYDLLNSTETMKQRYYNLTQNNYCASIYDTFMKEEYRTLITRWRLSCFDLRIERGRYDNIPRDQRLCIICNVLEDEKHVFFNCHAYTSIRTQFNALLQRYATASDLLNPNNKEDAKKVGLLIKLIEERRNEIF